MLPDRSEHGYSLRRRRHERILTSNDDKRQTLFTDNYTKTVTNCSPTVLISIVQLRFDNNKRICYAMRVWDIKCRPMSVVNTQVVYRCVVHVTDRPNIQQLTTNVDGPTDSHNISQHGTVYYYIAIFNQSLCS